MFADVNGLIQSGGSWKAQRQRQVEDYSYLNCPQEAGKPQHCDRSVMLLGPEQPWGCRHRLGCLRNLCRVLQSLARSHQHAQDSRASPGQRGNQYLLTSSASPQVQPLARSYMGMSRRGVQGSGRNSFVLGRQRVRR